ncbi:MAG: hypothetical protein CVV42_00935 [Candidatus Riflebacteria bacterium HGW-Riflebacteria-2]|jgi:multidrug resistance efflux pump|nr:MAG: hypothetical protein CVV42_00935 [Candidatus Riflebacteria bacterium HGW-Riflebacteria-2]
MSSHKYLNWQNLVIMIVFVAFAALAVSGLMRKKAALAQATPMPQPPLAVKTAVVNLGVIDRSVPALATVKSAASIVIKAETAGKIGELKYREGDRVTVGSVLAVIDSQEQKAQLQAARARSDSASGQVSAVQANLRALTSQLDAYQINLDYWKTTLARDEKLYEARAIAKSALDATINRHAEAESRLAALKSQVSAQKAQISAMVSQKDASVKDVAVWQARLDYAEILAPVDGIVSFRMQEEGNLVQPGVAIYTIEDVAMTRLIMQIPQQEAAGVRIGQAVTLRDGSSNGFVVSRIYPVQNEFRQVIVEASKPGEVSGLVYDMQIPVHITVESREGVIVPLSAGFIDFKAPEKLQIYIVEGDRARRMSINPLLRSNNGNFAVSPELVPAGTVLALGNYLENVRLPASFSVEVIR